MGRGQRITIVAHDASRTGAPAALASLLAHPSRPPAAEVRLVLLRSGPLAGEYRRSVPTLDEGRGVRAALRRVAAATAAVGVPSGVARLLRAAARGPAPRGAPDLVVANTLASLADAAAVAGRTSALVCHVHELDAVADRVLPRDPAERARVLARVDRFVAAGGWVAAMLTDRWGVPADRVVTIDGFVDPDVGVTEADVAAARAEVGAHDRPLVVGAGAAGHRKGIDLFVATLAQMGDGPTAPVGAWIGGDPSSVAWAEAQHDLAAAGLGDRVRLVPTVPSVAPYLAAADVVVSCAREDPFPLTVLEAGVHARPVVALESGGAADVLRRAGCADDVVASGDVIALSRRVAALCADPAARRDAGDRLRAHVTAEHTVDRWAPRWWRAVTESTRAPR